MRGRGSSLMSSCVGGQAGAGGCRGSRQGEGGRWGPCTERSRRELPRDAAQGCAALQACSRRAPQACRQAALQPAAVSALAAQPHQVVANDVRLLQQQAHLVGRALKLGKLGRLEAWNGGWGGVVWCVCVCGGGGWWWVCVCGGGTAQLKPPLEQSGQGDRGWGKQQLRQGANTQGKRLCVRGDLCCSTTLG